MDSTAAVDIGAFLDDSPEAQPAQTAPAQTAPVKDPQPPVAEDPPTGASQEAEDDMGEGADEPDATSEPAHNATAQAGTSSHTNDNEPIEATSGFDLNSLGLQMALAGGIIAITVAILLVIAGPIPAIIVGVVLTASGGWYWRTTSLRRKLEEDEARLQRELEENEAFIRSQRQDAQGTIGGRKIKGGAGATAALAWLSTMMQIARRDAPLFMNLDVGYGFACQRLGVVGGTPIQEFLDWVTSTLGIGHREFESRLPSARNSGVLVVGAEPEANTQEKPKAVIEHDEDGIPVIVANGRTYDPGQFQRTLRVVREGFGQVWVDTGPGDQVPVYQAVELAADVVCVSALETSGDSLVAVTMALDSIRSLDPEKPIMLIISAVDGPNEEKRAAYAARFGLSPENVGLIPSCQYVKDDGVVDPSQVPLSYLVALSRINVRLTQLLVEVNRSRLTASTTAHARP